jgi:tetratricopeptide (TPR) repeat protein
VVILALATAGVAGGAGLYLARSTLFVSTIDRGRAAYDRGDWKTATSLAAARLKEAPADRAALLLLARAAAQEGRHDSTRALYSRLGGASEMQAEDFFLLGRLIDREGDHEAARACWVAGLRADPKNAEILNEFARLYLQGAQFDLAERTAKALAARPRWEARGEFYLGRIALECDDPAAATTHLERALKLDPSARGAPESPVLYRKLLARALLGSGEPGAAAQRLRALIASSPDPESSWLLSRAALQAGDLSEAAEALSRSGSYRVEHPLEPEPAPYIGAGRCASCHRDTYQAEQKSHHARTFRRDPTLKDIPIPAGPLADPAAPEVTHSFESVGSRVRYATKDRMNTIRAMIESIFGSGHRGLTLVGRDDSGRTRELRLSHYADGPSWDVTTGHPPVPPQGEDYLGRFLSRDDLNSCFACHTTVPRQARDGNGPAAADRGIGCERCHGPGANHLKAVAAKLPDLAIAQPRVASGAEIVALCGQCHNPLGRAVSPIDPVAVRFPSTTLTWSRCYTESGGTFDCRTCHDPHRDLVTATSHYEAKCLSCHGKPGNAICPIDTNEGCISCHMPKAKIGVPHSDFTDHHIRAYPRRSGGN